MNIKKEYLPYYLSRTLLSVALSTLIFGLSWMAGIFTLLLIGFFALYLHSGWFEIDLDTPLTPLRRDSRGKEIQRKALIAAVACGLLFFVVSPYITSNNLSSEAGYLSLLIGVAVYFGLQFTLLSRP